MITITAESICVINTILAQRFNPCLIILYGSTATGKVHHDSDIDIAFLSDKNPDQYEVRLAAEELAAKLGQDVDLIDLERVSPVMQVQVLSRGQVIYDRDPGRRQNFTVLAMKKYARLNEEREPVLREIRRRGKVYG